MRDKISRILCFSLILLILSGLFVGCNKDEKSETPTDVSSATSKEPVATKPAPQANVMEQVGEDDPYTIVPNTDGKEIIILSYDDNQTLVMTVAEKTTLAQFLACVAPKDGYEVKIMDAAGAEVTDVNTELVKGMVFNVFKKEAETPEVSFIINVVAQTVIDDTIDTQDQIDIDNEYIDQNPDVPDSSQSVPAKGAIKLASIWSATYSSADAIGQIWNSTFTTIRNKQGISTAIINLAGDTAADVVVKDVMAGKNDVQVYEVPAYIARCIARKNCLADLKGSKTLKYSNFDNAGTTSMTFSGKLYGVAIDFKATKIMGVLYNKDLIKKYAPTYDVEKLYNEKKWTFDTFKSLAKECTRDLTGDGKPDVHGLTSNTNVIGMALTANAGGTSLMKNGKVEATMCSAEGITALEWMKKIYNTDKSWKFFASIKDSVNYFANGSSAMFASWLHYYNDIVPKANFKVGFVLMPMGPDQTEYISGQYDAQFYVVPKTNESQLDIIGEWLNGVSAASGKLINNEIKNLVKNGFDKSTQEIYKWGVNNATPEYSSGVFSSNISSQVDSSVTSSSKSPAKIMASIKSQAQKELDDFFNPLY